MADLDTVFQLSCTLGGEEIAPDIRRTLTGITEKVADVVRNLAGGAATSAPTTLWTDSQHGTAVNPLVATFTCGVLIVDPDEALTADYPISVEISVSLHNSTSVQNHYFRVTRQNPLILSTSIVGAMASLTADSTTGFGDIDAADANFPRVTRIRVHNPDSTQAVKVRLLLLK